MRLVCLAVCAAASMAQADAEGLMLDPEGRPLVEVLGQVQELAARECAEGHQASCALSARLAAALAEHNAVAKDKGAELAAKVLAARQCIAGLTRDDPPRDWATRVSLWCSTSLEVCDPKLMLIVGHASPGLRTELVGGLCHDKLCSGGSAPKPSLCSLPLGKAKTAVALVRAAFTRELPAPVAEALAAAFEKPRHPFFADAAAPAVKPKTRK